MNVYVIVINKHDLKLIEFEYKNDFNNSEKTLKKNDNCILKKNMKYLILCSGGCENFNERHFYGFKDENLINRYNDGSKYHKLIIDDILKKVLLGDEFERVEYHISNTNKIEVDFKKKLEEKDKYIKELEREIKKLKNNILNEQNNQKNYKMYEESIKKINENNNGLKFSNDDKDGFYDIIVDITSIKNLNTTGWLVKYPNKDKGRDYYKKKKDEPTIVVGVIGNGNKGKSFFLEKLSEYEIPKGFNVKTEGLSIRFGESESHNLAILDSAGQETPLLKEENNENNDNEEIKKNNSINQTDGQKDLNEIINESEIEEYSRDKLISEFFIQKFIIYKSNILIIVVGNITLNEQQLLTRVIKEAKDKQIFVIHNLQNFVTQEQIEDYIENTLKKLYNVKIKENIYQNFLYANNNKFFNKYFIEEDKKIAHLILVNDYSEISYYYNIPTIQFIKKEMEVTKERQQFPVIEECQKFLIELSEEILEENIKDKIGVERIDEDTDKIYIKELKKITLKKFVVDEMGYALNNEGNLPKYSHYVKDNLFHIFIELPGGGKIDNKVEIFQGYYLFAFEGIKNGDIEIENDNNEKQPKLLNKKSTRKKDKFKLGIRIPNTAFQLTVLKPADKPKFDKGVIEYFYKINDSKSEISGNEF